MRDITNQRDQFVALAARYGIPTMHQWREFVATGGLAGLARRT
jgi:hypothetical protein